MRAHVRTIIIICVLTQFHTSTSQERDEENLSTTYHPLQSGENSIQFVENSIDSNLLLDGVKTRGDSAKHRGYIRFEDNPPNLPDKSHFFPTQGDINVEENIHIENSKREEVFFNGDNYREDLGDIEDEQESISKPGYIGNKITKNTMTEDSDINGNNVSGRIIFEENNKILNPILNKKLNPGRKRRMYPIQNDKFLEPLNHFSTIKFEATHNPTKRPNYYQTGYKDSYPDFGSYQGEEPSRPLRNQLINQGHSGSTQYITENTAAPGIQVRPGKPSFGYLSQSGYQGHSEHGYAADPNTRYGQNIPYPGYGFSGSLRRPKSLTQQAVSAVAEALTSIALFDDKQCVPRLLCEVASGSAAGSPTLLKATTGLAPLLNILQLYNGATSSPLFLFGRAAVLGMTSTGNAINCQKAYPQCPQDPAELTNYLNNHNGGLTRFFGQPGRPQEQQNLEQFYNHLAGQNGYQQHSQQFNNYNTNNIFPKNNEPNSNRRDDKVIRSGRNDINSTLEAQGRILNRPDIDIIEEENAEEESTWVFPQDVKSTNKKSKHRRPKNQNFATSSPERGIRDKRVNSPLKFPGDTNPLKDRPDIYREKDFRKQKLIVFPNQNYFQLEGNYQTNTAINLQEYDFDYKHNFYVKRPKQMTSTVSSDDTETVYIVRGNSDPNHPEIVKVKVGQIA